LDHLRLKPLGAWDPSLAHETCPIEQHVNHLETA